MDPGGSQYLDVAGQDNGDALIAALLQVLVTVQ